MVVIIRGRHVRHVSILSSSDEKELQQNSFFKYFATFSSERPQK
jgi:hypothetical protein